MEMYYKILIQICIEDIDFAIEEAIPTLLDLASSCETPEYYVALRVAKTIISPNELFIEKYKEAWGDDRNISEIINKLKVTLEYQIKQNITEIAPYITEYKHMSHTSPVGGKKSIIENKTISLKTLKNFNGVDVFKRANHILAEDYDTDLEKRTQIFLYFIELSPFLVNFDYI